MLKQVVVKLNRACNLRCTYCYYINDDTPSLGLRMEWPLLELFLTKYTKYCEHHAIKGHIAFHGGEPLLMGKEYFRRTLDHEGFTSGALKAAVQTNGLLLDEEWIDLFESRSVAIGLSLDGPPEVNDKFRIGCDGRGSYDRVLLSIERMKRKGVHLYVLCVVDPAASGAAVFNHFVGLGIRDMDFLPPISNHAAQRLGGIDLEGVERYLIGAFKEWVARADSTIRVRLFCELMWRYMGVRSGGYSAIGVDNWAGVGVLETDGIFARSEEFQGLFVFDGVNRYLTSCDVRRASFDEIVEALKPKNAHVDCISMPVACQGCDMNDVCNGGSLVSRYDTGGSFNNPGVHCGSLYKLSRLIKEVCKVANAENAHTVGVA